MRPVELAQHYITRYISNPETSKNYLAMARLFDNFIGQRAIHEVTEEDVFRWREVLLAKLSVHSYNTYLRHLRILFKHACTSKFIDANPFEQVSAISRSMKSKCVSIDNILYVIKQLEQNNIVEPGWFWAIVVRFLLNTGIRRRQLVTLCWEHVDFNRRTILLIQEGSKNTREWTIPMTDAVTYDLMLLYERTKQVNGYIQGDDQVFCLPLFCGRGQHEKLIARHVSNSFCQLSQKTGIKLSAHRLRHTLGTRLGTAENADLIAIQELFGHQSISSTRRYVASNVGHIRRVLDKDGFGEELLLTLKNFSKST